MEPPQRDLQAAAAAVEAAAGEKGWTIKDLATAAGIDPATVTDFLSARRWPRMNTRGSLEKALGWPAGTIAQVAAGGAAPGLVDLEAESADELAAEARRLTDRQRAALLELVRAVVEADEDAAEPAAADQEEPPDLDQVEGLRLDEGVDTTASARRER